MTDLNILPEAKGRADAPSDDFKKLSSWMPEKADPRDPRNVPYGLGVETNDDLYIPRFLQNDPPVPDPNHRDMKENYDPANDPSPLCASERGVIEEPRIAMPKLDMSMSTMSLKAAYVPKELPLIISGTYYNLLFMCFCI
jgi:hypothetical protein